MARSQPADGHRDLSLIRASGSTARVLNLALVYERHGAEEDFSGKPLFRCSRLNRVLILKHAVRPHERALFDFPEPHTTKIVFPYSSTELGLGGTSVMVGEKGFAQALKRAVGDSSDDAAIEDDIELLCLMHELPSFDPFLLRENLRRAGREPARCFFDISDADIAAMITFVADEIAPLITLALGFGGRRAEKLAVRMAEKLMTDEGAQLLEPLRDAVHLSPAQYREGVFAWKGFLYYKWLMRDLTARHEPFAKALLKSMAPKADRAGRMEIERLKTAIATRAERALHGVSDAIGGYDDVFGALIRGNPGGFRDFLLQAPSRFIGLGEATGALKHMHSLWGFRFGGQIAPSWEADEAIETLKEFDRMLSGIDFTREDADLDLMLQ